MWLSSALLELCKSRAPGRRVRALRELDPSRGACVDEEPICFRDRVAEEEHHSSEEALQLLQRPRDLCQGRAATFLNKLIKRSRCRVLGYSAMGYADMGLGSCFETAGFGAMMGYEIAERTGSPYLISLKT